MGNPLAPLMNAQNAGALGEPSSLASLWLRASTHPFVPFAAGFNPFAEMGVNPNDPNYMQTMMQDPAVQQQINGLLSDPAVIDQLVRRPALFVPFPARR